MVEDPFGNNLSGRASTGQASCQSAESALRSGMALDPSMAVLVVDDQGTMIRVIRGLLRQLKILDVDEARDGEAALAKMRSKRYSLVISDWQMAPKTGYDLLRDLRADPQLKRTPFIMVTAESKTENVIAAKKAGVSNYIVKPFNAETLRTKIESVFATRTAPLPERQPSRSVFKAPQSRDATVEAPSSAAASATGVTQAHTRQN
jgi:two-component system, chemotaxis family, chemotaxis protein CheY